MTKYTTYRIATQWLHNSFILCNNITEIDESIWDNCRFEYEDEDGNPRDIFQYFITDASESDVEYLEENFPDLLFTYSEKLDCFVLCVDHCGTGWDHVPTPVSDELVEIWGDKILYNDSCNPPMIETSCEFVSGGKK